MQDKLDETLAPDQEDTSEVLPEASPDLKEADAADSLPQASDEADNEDDEILEDEADEDASPAQDRIFGMTRLCFRGTAIGLAFGMILAGLLKVQASTALIIGGGALGFFICSRTEKKKKKEE